MTKSDKIRHLAATTNMSRAQIAREVGCDRSVVTHVLGTLIEHDAWESERVRHREFFNGLTPKQEYDEHIKRRNACAEKI